MYSPERAKRVRTLAALAFLLLLTAGFYWRLTVSGRYTWLESPDMAFQVRPWLDFQAREFHEGRFPIWTPYEWGGHSLIGQAQPGATNPLNWILFALPLEDGHIPLGTLHWYWVLIHWLGAVFCYALCRDLKAGHAPSLLGGCIFALTGFVGHTDWPQILMTAIWMPLVFLFFARVARGEKPLSSAALCGAALGMSFLAGHHQIPIAASVLMGALWLWHVAGRPRDRKAWACAAVFLCVWISVAAAQWLPTLEYGRHAVRWVGDAGALTWRDRVPYEVHRQFSMDARILQGLVKRGMDFYVSPFVGFVAAGLALAALIRRFRDGAVRLFAAIAAGGLILALGTHTPIYRYLYLYVPLVEKARTPAFSVVLLQVGIAVLAALGLQALTSKAPRLAWLALPVFLFEAGMVAPHHGLLDRPGAYWKSMRDQSDIAKFLRSRPGWFRVQVNDEDVPYNFGDFFGIEQFGGYLPSMPENVFRALGRADTPRLFGVRYYVGRAAPDPAFREVFVSQSGLRVFENDANWQPLTIDRETPCEGADEFRVIARYPGSMSLSVKTGRPGTLVVGDAYYKGWRATVDGRSVPIREYEGVARAVSLGQGSHTVEFRYLPWTAYAGAAFTLVGLAITAWLMFRERTVGATLGRPDNQR